MRLFAIALLVLAGCYKYQPGAGVTPDFATQWGCNPEYVAQRTAAAKAMLPEGELWVPQVGWTACELMARNGRPTRVDHQQSGQGRSASWWYHSKGDTKARLVTLVLEGEGRLARWSVNYVGW